MNTQSNWQADPLNTHFLAWQANVMLGFVRLAVFAISQQHEDCSTSSVSQYKKSRSADIRLNQLISPGGHRRFIHIECERDICDHAMVLRGNVSDKWASDSYGYQNTCQNAFHNSIPSGFFLKSLVNFLSRLAWREDGGNSNRDANLFAASLPKTSLTDIRDQIMMMR